MTISVSENVYAAEDQLCRGLLENAYSSALNAVKSLHDPQMLARGYSVLIQADFQLSKLTELEAVLQQCGHKLHQLPVPTILLWGVVALELDQTAAARTTLERYLSDISTAGVSLNREDAMALSRLYAVQLLGSICHDFAAAATWVEAGGAGLSQEQQQLLLLELEESEEVMAEERLAEWAAATAADTYQESSSLRTANSAAAAAAADGGQVADCLSPMIPLLSSAAADDAGSVCASELGPSASGAALSGAPSGGSTWGAALSGAASGGSAWGADTLDRVDRIDSGSMGQNAVSSPAAAAARGDGVEIATGGQQANDLLAAAAAAAAPMGGLCKGNAAVDHIVLGRGTELLNEDRRQQPLAAAAAAGSQSADLITPLPATAGTAAAAAAADRAAAAEVDRLSNSASPLSLYAWAAPDSSNHAQQQQQQAGPHATQLHGSTDSSAAVAAAPRVVADGVDGTNGNLCPQDEDQTQSHQQQQQHHRQMSVGLPAEGNAFCTMTGLLNVEDVNVPGHPADPDAVTSDLRSSVPDSSSSSNSSRDQQDIRHDKQAAGIAADDSTSQLSAAAVGHDVQQQQQSLTEWMSSKASNAWQSQQVQATLAALNLQGLEPWEIAGGAGALLLLGYGMYRKRRSIRRAATDLTSSVVQTAQMALGMAVNPMAAVPGTGHLSRP